MLLFSLVSCLFTYAILRLQNHLPLNPQGFGALSPDLAFNTAVSFTTNTNWQSYTGESTMSYLSQMVALVIHNFGSAATGIAMAAALVRGIARHSATTARQFLGGPGAHHLLSAAADLRGVRRLPGVAGHDPKFQALHEASSEAYTVRQPMQRQSVTTNARFKHPLDAGNRHDQRRGVMTMCRTRCKGQPS